MARRPADWDNSAYAQRYRANEQAQRQERQEYYDARAMERVERREIISQQQAEIVQQAAMLMMMTRGELDAADAMVRKTMPLTAGRRMANERHRVEMANYARRSAYVDAMMLARFFGADI
jgi:hypothetical protein